MTENKNSLQKYAMMAGTYIGVYWTLKFTLFPLGFTVPFLSLLFIALTLAVPFIGYYYTKLYRNKINHGVISFPQAFAFSFFMYMFASLLVSVAHYVYFQYIDQGFIVETYTKVWHELLEKSPEMEANKQIINEMIETARATTPIDLTIQLLSWDVFWGGILAIPTALAVMRKKA